MDAPRALVVTVSDRCARGDAIDRSGPRAVSLLSAAGYPAGPARVVPDGDDSVSAALRQAVRDGMRVVVMAIPASEMLKTPEALRVVGPAAFGYPEVEFIPMPGVFGSGLRG